MRVRVTSQFRVEDVVDLDAETDDLHDALFVVERELDGVSGGDVTAELSSSLVSISFLIDAPDWSSAERLGERAVGAVIEKVGGVVVDMERPIEQRVKPASSEVDPVIRAHVQTTELVPA